MGGKEEGGWERGKGRRGENDGGKGVIKKKRKGQKLVSSQSGMQRSPTPLSIADHYKVCLNLRDSFDVVKGMQKSWIPSTTQLIYYTVICSESCHICTRKTTAPGRMHTQLAKCSATSPQ